jgi:transcriptional regulator with PAS, ATPase and Fis domain
MIEILYNYFEYICEKFDTVEYLMIIKIVSLLMRGALFSMTCIISVRSSPSTRKIWFLLAGILLCACLCEVSWIMRILGLREMIDMGESIFHLISRMLWPLEMLQYSLIIFFIEYLKQKEKNIIWKKQYSGLVSLTVIFFIYFIGEAIIYYDAQIPHASLGFLIHQIAYLYILFLMAWNTWLIRQDIQHAHLPKIITHQLKIMVLFFFVPTFFLEIIWLNPLTLTTEASYFFVILYTIAFTLILYYCGYRMFKVRFLNINEHVYRVRDAHVLDKLENALYQMRTIDNVMDFRENIRNFFPLTLGIPLPEIIFILRNEKIDKIDASPYAFVENFLNKESGALSLLHESKIFIRDEMEFTVYYKDDARVEEAVRFMQHIKADVFLPIYDKQQVVGYLVVKENCRVDKLFSKQERDEMLLFAHHLSSMVQVIHHRNVEALLAKNKEKHDELFFKYQEFNQSKEALRTFLRMANEQAMGIMIAQRHRFEYVDVAAEDLLGLKARELYQHPLLHQLLGVAGQVLHSHASQTVQLQNVHNNTITVMGIPCLDASRILMIIHRQDLRFLLKDQLNALKDPASWDYALYLETTESGKLINQLLPGTSETILNAKIDLLKAALHRNATLLMAPSDDLAPIVEVLHHLSLRRTLYPIYLMEYEHGNDVAVKLFGMNPVFGEVIENPVIKMLDAHGTLFIQNVEFLSLTTQDHIADIIVYGYYRPLQSLKKIASDVRIICSTEVDLAPLVEQGRFSARLYEGLHKAMVQLPSLLTLPATELGNVVDQVAKNEQDTMPSDQQRNLSYHEKNNLMAMRPVSFKELSKKTRQLITNKAKKTIEPGITVNHLQHITDPEILAIARLGKYALREKTLFTQLWCKIKSQSEIAHLLGVNRSTVNRRCKMYNLSRDT